MRCVLEEGLGVTRVGGRCGPSLVALSSSSNGRFAFRILSTVRASRTHCLTLLPACSSPGGVLRSDNRLIVIGIKRRSNRRCFCRVRSSSRCRDITSTFVGHLRSFFRVSGGWCMGILFYSQAITCVALRFWFSKRCSHIANLRASHNYTRFKEERHRIAQYTPAYFATNCRWTRCNGAKPFRVGAVCVHHGTAPCLFVGWPVRRWWMGGVPGSFLQVQSFLLFLGEGR